MKRTAILLLALTLVSAPALAGPGRAHGGHAERLAERLGLDDDQTEQVQTILAEQRNKHRAEFEALREQGVERDSDEARQLRESARAETRDRLSTVLSAEQLAEFDEMREKHKGRKGARKRRHAPADDEVL